MLMWWLQYFEDYNNQLHCLKLPQFIYRNSSCESKYGWPLCFTGGHLKVIWSCYPLIYHSIAHNALSISCSHIRLLFPPSFHTMKVVPVSPSFSKSDFVCQAHFDKIPFSLYLSIQLLLSIPVIFLYYILWAIFVHFLPFMYCSSSTILAPYICPSVIVLVLLYLFSTQINSDHLIFFNVVPRKQPVAEVPKGSGNSELPLSTLVGLKVWSSLRKGS